jgi:hypothetical protein
MKLKYCGTMFDHIHENNKKTYAEIALAVDSVDRSDTFDSCEDSFEFEYPHLKSIEKILEESSEEDETVRKTDSKYKLITRRIDFPKIQHKKDTGFSINTSTCRRIHLPADGNIRSGAIIYTHWKGQTYFCLGVDSDYGDLTDFAGGVKKTDVDANGNTSVIIGGLRELREESLGVFGDLTPEDVADDIVFWSNNMAIIFIELAVNPFEIQKEFMKRFSNHADKKNLEVSELRWLTLEDFRDSILSRGERLYSRVRKILSRVINIVEVL